MLGLRSRVMIALTVVRRSRRRLLILSSWIGYSDKPGGRLVFYTDGVTEAMDPAGAQFGEDGCGSEPGARRVRAIRSVPAACGRWRPGPPDGGRQG